MGLDGPTEELSNWLTDSKKTVKVVSIVGFGGLGKTTLAKQLYDKVGGKFDVKAFVPISQRPNVSGILNSMQSKLGIKDSSQHKDDHDIIDGLREHLKHKRYFIVIDDLWDHLTWETVRCAFPENSNGSRIIVTTRLEDVAFAACCNNQQCIYKMKYLNDEDSKRLFFGRISGSNYPSNVEEASAGILKKCGGLPLAVITVASLLACRPEILRKDWESIRNYLDMQFGTNLTLDGVKLILNLSYIHLPLRLRACCLYLGMYPEDEEIMRDDLARQWIAEGFVSIIPGLDLEDVAKSYFNELINVSMIQPERIEYGEVLSCRVHDMMLDLIQSKCVEDNFVSVAYKYEDMARLHDCQYKVRRLLNLCTSEGTDGTISGTIIAPSMSQVRSFSQHGNAKHSPSLSLFKHLRVLVLYMEGMTVDLTAINQLFQLRYLKVSAANGSIQLPTKIKGPVHLETLELVEGDFKSTLPSDIVDLPCLSHLIVDRFHRTPDLPNGISQMKSLRTLHGFEIGRNSVEDIVGLGDLTNLRDLKLYFWRKTPETMDALSSLIGKLRNVKHLSLIGLSLGEDNMLLSISEPPLHIEVLELPYFCSLDFPNGLVISIASAACNWKLGSRRFMSSGRCPT